MSPHVADPSMPSPTPVVSRMPAELLCEIFLHLRAACEPGFAQLVMEIARSAPDADPRSVWWPHQWITVTHVCRHWREIAISFSRLWNRITLTSNKDRLLTFLQRSKQAPLTFFNSRFHPLPEAQYLGLLNQYLYRAVSIHGLMVGVEEDENLSLGDSDRDGAELPLQKIRLTATHELGSIPVLSSASLPNLRVAKVTAASFQAVRNFLRPTLTHLELSEPPTAAGWLDLLRHMPLLEDLDLGHGAIDTWDVPSPSLLSSERPSLSRLERLAIMARPGEQVCRDIVKNLAFPPTTHLSLGMYDPISSEDDVSLPRDVIKSSDPDEMLCTGAGASFAFISLLVRNARRDGGFSMAFFNQEYDAGDFIVSLFTSIRLPRVKKLSFEDISASRHMFRFLNLSLPNVEEITLARTDVATDFMMDMDTATEDERIPFGWHEPQDRPALPHFFQNLTVLFISRVTWDDEYFGCEDLWEGQLFRQLQDVLARRRAMGLVLKRLQLDKAVHLGYAPPGIAFTFVAEDFQYSRAWCGDEDCPCMHELEV